MIGRKTDNINVELGTGETWESYVGRLREFLSRIRWQSEGHISWYTHKNPAGCWICELLDITDRLLDNDKLLAERDDNGFDIDREDLNVDEEPIND